MLFRSRRVALGQHRRQGKRPGPGLALGADKPCLGVSTLEAMAWGARALGGDLCCVMDARAGQVYNALFTVEDGRVRRLCDDRAIKLTELAEEIGLPRNRIILSAKVSAVQDLIAVYAMLAARSDHPVSRAIAQALQASLPQT